MSQNKPHAQTKTEHFPVIVEDNKNGQVHLSKLSPSTKIPFYGIVGTVKSVTKLKSGKWNVECFSRSQQEKLLNTTNLAGVSVSCYTPTPKSDGIVYGLQDPLALKNHPDVVKFQVISEVNARAEFFTTRIVFAIETLPPTLTHKGVEYTVHPYTHPGQRCTICQRLSHTKQSCTYDVRCSRCGEGHSRSRCHASNPKCANCQGPHSAAYRNCPLKNGVNYNDENKSPNNMQENDKNNNPKPSYADMTRSSLSAPSFISFIVGVVIPILSLNRNVNLVNQIISIYNKFFNIKPQNVISDDIRQTADNLLSSKLYGKTSKTDKKEEFQPTTTDKLEDKQDPTSTNNERKQLITLKNLDVKRETKNMIIGDSTTKGVQNDKITQTFCIPGLNINDVEKWLDTKPSIKLRNIIFHVGINSCRRCDISVTNWVNLINLAKSNFPDTNLIFSSILPHKGSLKKNIQKSNVALKDACNYTDTFFVNNRSLFSTYTGQVLPNLYSRDGIHPNKTGASVLSKNLFSVLEEV